jgi:hypothetical protein
MPRGRLWAALVSALLASGPAAAQTNPSLYLVDGQFSGLWTRIFRVDAASGALELRADLGTTYTPMLGMAAASRTTLYLTGTDTGPDDQCGASIACLLLRVELDPLSTVPAVVEVIGTIREGGSVLGGITGLTFRSDGLLYAIIWVIWWVGRGFQAP